MKKTLNTIAALIILFAVSNGKELNVNKDGKNVVKFISDASLEQFEGVTSNIDGYMYWANEDLTEESQLYFEVDLESLDTGIGLRNRHMRENYLETDKYRYTNFSGKIVSAVKTSNGIFEVMADGTISIHGVVKPLMLTAQIERIADDVYNIKSGFEVKLSDFNIEIPSIMFLKLSELIKVEVDFNMIVANKAG